MKWTLARFEFTDMATVGGLYDETDSFLCYTLEDAIREKKVYERTAIPKGTYELDYTHSGRFGRLLPLLVDVPLFNAIRIHAGNAVEDSAGCILTGLEKSYVAAGNYASWNVRRSREALQIVCHRIETLNAPVSLTILGGYSPEVMQRA